MRKLKAERSLFVLIWFGAAMLVPIQAAHAESDIDIRYLQNCLKSENSSLDVLVLMDSSKSLRDARPDEKSRKNRQGSDPQKIRGKILMSSLKLLRELAEDSKRDFQISLRNFGNNTTDLKPLQDKWVDWTVKIGRAHV